MAIEYMQMTRFKYVLEFQSCVYNKLDVQSLFIKNLKIDI